MTFAAPSATALIDCAVVVAVVRAASVVEPFPASVMLDGEYGVTGISSSLPVLLGAQGLVKTVEIPLTETEVAQFRDAADRAAPVTNMTPSKILSDIYGPDFMSGASLQALTTLFRAALPPEEKRALRLIDTALEKRDAMTEEDYSRRRREILALQRQQRKLRRGNVAAAAKVASKG